MIRICWAKYIIDKKFNGYYLWERVAPFKYKERLSGVESLVDFFLKDDRNIEAEHILTEKQAKELDGGNYKSGYKTHIEMVINAVNQESASFDYGTFDNFMTEFTKVELNEGWKREQEYPKSFFSENSKIHASMILFGDTYMIMKSLKDFIKLEEFLKENSLNTDRHRNRIIKWSKV